MPPSHQTACSQRTALPEPLETDGPWSKPLATQPHLLSSLSPHPGRDHTPRAPQHPTSTKHPLPHSETTLISPSSTGPPGFPGGALGHQPWRYLCPGATRRGRWPSRARGSWGTAVPTPSGLFFGRSPSGRGHPRAGVSGWWGADQSPFVMQSQLGNDPAWRPPAAPHTLLS